MSGPDNSEARQRAENMAATSHHFRCNTRTGGECDCYKARPDYQLAAWALALESEVQALREERDLLKTAVVKIWAEIPQNSDGSADSYDGTANPVILTIARAALARSTARGEA